MQDARRPFILLVGAGLALVASGCGPGGVGATCTGIVTIDGRPAPAGIRVDFEPQGPQGSPSTGVTDATGQYELFFTAARKGVMPDECLVRVTVARQTSADGIPQEPESLKDVRIPAHYGRQSAITRTVKPGHNTIDIAIDTSAAVPQPK